MSQKTANSSVLRVAEWGAAAIGAVNCVLVPLLFAQQGGSDFPFPFLYFMEIVLVGPFVLIYVATRPGRKAQWQALPWVAAGIMLAFVLLGAFSIGFFLIPAFLAFTITGVLVDLQTGGAIAGHPGFLIVAAVTQGALMALLTLS